MMRHRAGRGRRDDQQQDAAREWLKSRTLALRGGNQKITDDDLPMALYWIHQGVLDMDPPSTYPDAFMVHYRRGDGR
jgi:hypothetical protein